ncbi:MAG: hypothetical protein GY947_21845 [Rhodobacteraceae bacterium]|nr:hypothetical protein [Paracoccaceae bacterium]
MLAVGWASCLPVLQTHQHQLVVISFGLALAYRALRAKKPKNMLLGAAVTCICGVAILLGFEVEVPSQFWRALPFILTLVVLSLSKAASGEPRYLTIPYFRGGLLNALSASPATSIPSDSEPETGPKNVHLDVDTAEICRTSCASGVNSVLHEATNKTQAERVTLRITTS